MNLLNVPLVNWGMGTIIIIVFAVVCIVMVAIVYNLSRSTNSTPANTNEEADTNDIKNSLKQ